MNASEPVVVIFAEVDEGYALVRDSAPPGAFKGVLAELELDGWEEVGDDAAEPYIFDNGEPGVMAPLCRPWWPDAASSGPIGSPLPTTFDDFVV
jgi:hypothetical protein